MNDYSELKRLAEAAINIKGPIFDMDGPVELCRLAEFVAENPNALLALIAENEALRADAERYRFLRRTDCWQDLDNDHTYDGQLPSIAFSLWIIGARDDAENRSGEMLDRSIDYFMSKEPKA